MSTRCQVLVEGSDVVIYRHSDGYPEEKAGVLASLLPLVKDFMASRGADPFYLTAHIIARFIQEHFEWFEAFKKEARNQDHPPYDEHKWLGYGVEAWAGQFHGDVEYVYVVKPDHVEVRTMGLGEPTLENTKVIKRVKFDGKAYRVSKKKGG